MNLKRQNIEDILALSPMQEGILFQILLHPDSQIYQEQLSLTLDGIISPQCIEQALNHVIRCNEMLRTIFKWKGLEKPVQIILKDVELKLHMEDFSQFSSKETTEQMLLQWKTDEHNSHFDLEKGPLFRATLIKLTNDCHELIISNHHIIYDGWSMGIILQEFMSFYQKLLHHETLSIYNKTKFKNYIKWCEAQDSEGQQKFWKKYLADFEMKTVLPYDQEKTTEGIQVKKVEKSINHGLYTGLQELAKKEKVTLATIFSLAWGILLQRYNNFGDVVFGTTVSGRSPEITGVDEIVGLFINTLPCRIWATPKEKVVDVLHRVHDDLHECQLFASIPLVEIKSLSEISSQDNLFDSLLVVENYPLDQRIKHMGEGLQIEKYSLSEMNDLDLTVEVKTFDECILSMGYNTECFSYDIISRLGEYLTNILTEIIADHTQEIREIRMISEMEKNLLLYDFNDTIEEYLKEKTLNQLFEEQVFLTPDKLAVVFAENYLTYGELNVRANQLARILRHLGVGPEVIVGLWCSRSIEMIIGLLAVVKAGGAYLPMDPEYPVERIEYMLEDSNSLVLLTDQAMCEQLSFTGKILYLDDEELYQGNRDNLENLNQPNDLIYIIYTSGSTGLPKGVMIEHYNVNRLLSKTNMVNVTSDDRILQTCSIAFDVSTFEIWGTLLNGASLYLIDKDDLILAQRLEKKMEDYQITMLWLTTPLFNQLIEADPAIFKGVRTLLVGGDALSPKHINQVRSIYPELKVINGYGPTESTVFATYFEIIEEYQHNIPIGWPLTNTQIYILDRNQCLQPLGAVGELCIGGDGLARGYLNRQQLTLDKFIPHPFKQGDRLYRTGDLARWLPDGTVEFLGRMDNQVKIRGFRIEVGEVEVKLLSHKDLKEAVILVREDEQKNKYLCAYYTSEQELTAGELESFLRERLPHYMIPSYFIQVKEMPLTPNGKINRKALLELGVDQGIDSTLVAPTNEIELRLARIWSEILGVKRVSLHDDFFHLGGHSLKATQLVARIVKEFQIELSLKEVFQNSVLHDLAQILHHARTRNYAKIPKIDRKPYYPLSSAQNRLFILNQLEPNTISYNIYQILILDGELNLDRLRESIQTLIIRHEALRTSFAIFEGTSIQVIHDVVEWVLEEWAGDEDELPEIMNQFVRPFDLKKAPLFRLGLVQGKKKQFLLVDMHHIISDGFSIQILINDFIKVYQAQELSDLQIQYRDFAAWQNKRLQSTETNSQREYWLKVLQGELPVLQLPTDFPRPGIKSYIGDQVDIILDQELTAKLNIFAIEHQVTLYMVLLAIYNLLLQIYTGQADFLIGSPIANRSHVDLEKIIGMFVNTLVMRNQPKCNQKFKQFLSEVKANALSAYENQDYQFEQLIDDLALERDMSRSPVFDTMFVLQNGMNTEFTLPMLQGKPYKYATRTSKFDLTLRATEISQVIELTWEYSTALFKPGTIQQMGRHYIQLLKEVLQDPEITIGNVNVLSDDEREQLLTVFNNTQQVVLAEQTIDQIISRQAILRPEATAVIWEGQRLTYEELNHKANQLAHLLRAKGVKPDDCLGLMVNTSPELVVGILGILKAGGAYLPIDPVNPEERIRYVLADSQTRFLLTNIEYLQIPTDGLEVIQLAQVNQNIEYYTDLTPVRKPFNLTYVIYTSGSTGQPKGVGIEDHSLVNYAEWFTKKAEITDSDSTVLLSSYAFDLGYTSLWSSLTTGATLHLISTDIVKEPTKLVEYLHTKQITFIKTTPSLFHMLIHSPGFIKESTINTIRLVVLGGEKIRVEDVEKYWTHNPHVWFMNHYGPTEATIGAISILLKPGDLFEYASRPVIGKPNANMQAYILDSAGRPVPLGVIGELCLAGAGLARGYLNRPELTAERFVVNPLFPGERMYKTGDLARWLADGQIEFIGRIDHQVKIRGYRVEVQEIENQLLQYPEILKAIVIDDEDVAHNSYLIAYLVSATDITISDLRQYLIKILPEYMIPSFFIQIKEVPLTGNGKLNRKALPKPDGNLQKTNPFTPPSTHLERELARIWSEVLKIQEIGVLDNFFELGGHSLKATQLIARVYQELQIELPLRQVFQKPTVQELAMYLEDVGAKSYIQIPQAPKQLYYPLSSAQKRLFVLQQLSGPNTGYNMPVLLKVSGKLDSQRFKKALKQLVKRQESLRTSFQLIDGEPKQKIHPELTLQIQKFEIDHRDITRVMSEYLQPFDLTQAPLMRVGQVIMEQDEFLIFDMHHIIADGFSMGILVDEFLALYLGDDLPQLQVQYKDFAVWQNERFQHSASKVIDPCEKYWLETLSGELPVLNLPYDYPRPAVLEFTGDRLSLPLGDTLSVKLQKMAVARGITPFMLLLTAYNILLSRYTGQEDIIIGSPIAGRQHRELEPIIGMFVNTLIFRNQPIAQKTCLEFLHEVKEKALEAFEHQDYQFEMLVEKLSLERDLSRNPLFDTLFVLQNIDRQEMKLADLTLTPYPFKNRVSKFDLVINIVETETGYVCNFEYRTQLFREQTIQQMARHFKNIIQGVLKAPECLIEDLQMLTVFEKERLLNDFNQTETRYPKHQTINQIFAEQVRMNPERIAVFYGGQALTYQDLSARAYHLATKIRAQGMGEHQIVGLMVERSLELAIGIMGILLAGGAYMPISPDYPSERIQFMLEDGDVRILITQKKLRDNALSLEYSGEVMIVDHSELLEARINQITEITHPDDLAYIIYTSGSTGKPKGVMIEHKSVLNLVVGLDQVIYANTLGSNDHLHVALVAPFVFDASVKQIFAALLLGHSLYIVPEELRRDGAGLIKYYADNRIDVSDGTPTHLNIMLSSVIEEASPIWVKKFVIGGEALPGQVVSKFNQVFGQAVEIINIYGPAECTVDATAYYCTGQQLSGTVPIGYPLANVKMYVLDQRMHLVPEGVIGEIYIGGEGVGRGYLNRLELTQEKFVPNPFIPGTRMYKTGDLGRWLSNGVIDFVGRIDHQVKIRGVRIEPGEIQAQLLRHPMIKEAVVLAGDDASGTKYLAAFYVAERDLDIEEVSTALGEELPQYMIPDYFIRIDRIPVTKNGKIDQRALLALTSEFQTGVEYLQPTTDTEKRVALIWSEVLGLEKISILEDFFTLGGHSLKATKLAVRLTKEFDIEFPLAEVFKRSTIRGQSQYVESLHHAPNRVIIIKKAEDREYYPVSSAQKRLYFLNQLTDQNLSYNMPVLLRVEGNVDFAKLTTALQKLVQRQESLRTSFVLKDGEPMQLIHSEVGLVVQKIMIPKGNIEEVVTEFIQPFDLSKPPLVRVGQVWVNNTEYLIFDMHHIISDGVSMSLLVDELTKLYQGIQLADLPLQYKDFSVWQRDILNSAEENSLSLPGERYWLELLSGELPVLQLPDDYPRPAVLEYAGARHSRFLGQELTQRLQGFANEQGVTPYMVLLAAYYILLYKYSGQEDLLVGTPIAGRLHEDLEPIIGMFVNTLVLRNQLTDQLTFKEFLHDVKDRLVQAYANQEYQFDRLVEKLDAERDLSRNPLFDTMFVLQNTERAELEFSGLRLIPEEFKSVTSKFDLTVIFQESLKGYSCTLEYRTKLFKSETIIRLGKHLLNIVNEVIEQPELTIGLVKVIDVAEQNQLLFEFNQAVVHQPPKRTIQQLFEEQVTKSPDQLAVVFEDKHLTYTELNQRANQLARTLRHRGVAPEKIVGVWCQRSLEVIVGVLAIVKAGGAYLPLDPETPSERVEYMLQDSESMILLSEKELVSSLDYAGEIIYLTDESLYHGDTENLENMNQPHDLLNVIYTSGSTGQPKGVMVEHHSVNSLIANNEMVEFTADERYLQTASIAFDASTFEIWGTLLHGATLFLIRKVDLLIANRLEEKMQEYQITMALITTPLFNHLIEVNPRVFRGMRTLILGGDSLSPKHVQMIRSLYPKLRVINAYGPTEGTVITTYLDIKEDYQWNIPIGRPLNHTQVYILDQMQQLKPLGAIGELCIGGAGLARGYKNRAELTQEKFLPHPFIEGQRIYRTGDLARWLPNGLVQFLGRIDQQVKIRGFRIELGEIEVKLGTYQDIKESVVLVKEDLEKNKYLCAYYTSERKLSIVELEEYLADRLPRYMIPAYFVQIEQMPLTSNGKINRKALLEIEVAINSEQNYVPPTTEIELRLVQIWQDVLGAEVIGIEDDFFRLGGHSLKATSLIARINQELQVEIPLKEFFKKPTIKDVAYYIETSAQKSIGSIEKVGVQKYYPVSSAQKRLFVLNQLNEPNTSYNMPVVLKVAGKLDSNRLQMTLQRLLQRQESLRTSFVLFDGEPVQQIHQDLKLHLQTIEVQDDEVRRVIQEFIQPFDLSQAPLMRIAQVFGKDELFLIFDMHHIISDGVSRSIMINEFMKIYQGDELSELKIQYKDFAVWQNKLFQSPEIQKMEEYWLQILSGELPILNLNHDFPRPTILDNSGDRLQLSLGQELTQQLKELALGHDVTTFMLLLAAYNILLNIYSGQEDIIIGSPIAGRGHGDLEQIIGMFVNTVVFRNAPTSQKTFATFLTEVKEQAIQVYDNQDYPFEMLVDKLGIHREINRNPVFDTIFALQNIETQEFCLEGLTFSPYEFANSTSKFDLSLIVNELADGFNCVFEYSTSLFRRDTIERLANHWVTLLRELSTKPWSVIGEIELLSPEEKELLMVHYNNTSTNYPKAKTLQKLFVEQVEFHPEQIALVFEEKELTYLQVNQKANQLARVLQSKGVVPGNVVGLLVERSLEMLIGIFAILKAGGAYLPIDPDFPKERITFMLEDSECRLLLTQNSLLNISEYTGEMIDIQEMSIYTGADSNLEVVQTSADLAYLMYTSGTTGQPKGTMITHYNISRIAKETNHVQMQREDRVLQLSNYIFDGSTFDIYATLLNGASLVLVSKETAKNIIKLAEVIEKAGITVFFITTALFNILVDTRLEALNNVRRIYFGGEKASLHHVRKAYSYLGSGRLCNMYGPTESTYSVTYYLIEELAEEAWSVPIGKPLANTEIYILGINNRLQPVGVVGEICVGGDGLATGYLKRPDLTEEKFVPNPFRPGERMYRTGDLGYWQIDGNIQFAGRIDHQVKIRGYRIELGEIETRLKQLPEVQEALVVDQVDDYGNKYLCAYLLSANLNNAEAKDLDIAKVKQSLATDLPDFMIPTYFIQLTQLPLTLNGKIDRKSLPKPETSVTQSQYVAPKTPLEEALVKIWSQVLNIRQIGVAEDFFAMGGHSLKATRLVAMIHKELGLEVELQEIFKNPTIAQLAAVLENRESSTYLQIKPIAEKQYYELSYSQNRLWFLNQLEPDSTAYNMPGSISLPPQVDKVLLKKIMQILIERHESLRTRFMIIDSQPVQVIERDVQLELAETDLRHLEATEQATRYEELYQQELSYVFDLAKAPLFRGRLVRMNAGTELIYVIHHIISDGWSQDILHHEFAHLYQAGVTGEEIQLTPIRIQYKDYAVWQNAQLTEQTEPVIRAKQFWLEQLTGELPVLNLPVDYPYAGLENRQSGAYRFVLPAEVAYKFKTIAQTHQTSLFAVLLTSFQIFLARITGQQDILIGMPIAGRDHEDLKQVIGFFINTTIIRSQVNSQLYFNELLDQTHDLLLKTLAFQSYPLEMIVDELKIQYPKISVFLNMLNMGERELEEISDYSAYHLQQSVDLKFDLVCYLREYLNGIEINCHYLTGLFKPETITYLMDRYSRLVTEICQDQNKVVGTYGETKKKKRRL